MSTRLEFVLLARLPDANVSALCGRFGISRKTAYQWLQRYRSAGEDGLQDQSRRPHASPATAPAELESQVLDLNTLYPCWGGRKLRAWLPLSVTPPHHSTIDAILRRHGGQVEAAPSRQDDAPSRFEHPAPNLLWQMDFKGHFALTDRAAGRCHPLTILDDHSRFNLCLAACGNELRQTVHEAMTATFARYGLPERITADNGSPWGMTGSVGLTQLEVWLVRLGIKISHSDPIIHKRRARMSGSTGHSNWSDWNGKDSTRLQPFNRSTCERCRRIELHRVTHVSRQVLPMSTDQTGDAETPVCRR